PAPSLAAAADAAWLGTQPPAAHQPLEDPRQPAPQLGGAGADCVAGLGMDVAPGFAARLDSGRAGGARLPAITAVGAPGRRPASAAARSAAAADAAWLGPQPPAAHQPLEDPRQPAPQLGGAGADCVAGLGMDVAPGFAARLDSGRAGGARLPAITAVGAPGRRPASAAAVRRVPAGRGGGTEDGGRTGAAPDHAAREPRLRNGARY